MYKILGADQKEYGPVDANTIIQWIEQARANALTPAQAEGTAEWKPLSHFPEFAEALRRKGMATPPPVPPAPATSGDLFGGDYRLEIGACFSKGWSLFKSNMGTLLGITALYCVIEGLVVVLGRIPVVGYVFSLGNIVIGGPLMAGLFLAFIRQADGQPVSVGNLFAGFSSRFLQFMLASFVPGVLAGLAAVPGAVIAGAGFFLAVKQHMPVLFAVGVLGALLALVPFLYLSISWQFTLLVTLNKRVDFWTAMNVSRKQVTRHFWAIFGFIILSGLFNLAGFLACGVGLLFTAPTTIGAFIYAYDTIFGRVPGTTRAD
jgi:hypothetical protein